MKIYEALSEICRELEIYEFGITDTSPFLEIRERLIDFNIFCEQDLEKRINPLLTMEEAKSIICALFPYARNKDAYGISSDIKGIVGTISSGDINLGLDYHIYVKRRLGIIADSLKERFGGRFMCFCDTGPLVDKEVAARSGLCKYGRNSLAVNKRYGSLFYIGYILTDLAFDKTKHELIQGERLSEICVNCSKCVDCCPAAALSADGVLHRRCVSFMSQKKGMLTVEEKALLGNTLFGCHICQNVCPANEPANFTMNVSAEECLKLTNREFKHKFGNTAVSWLGKTTLARNAAIVLENMAGR